MDVANQNSKLVVIFFAAVVAVIGVLGAYIGFFQGDFSDSQEVWGQFGDYMGGVLNPILALLALLALLKTISLQSSELALSRRELRRSATALQRQNDSLRQQSFEGTLFHMLALHHSIVESLTCEAGGDAKFGRNCFSVLRDQLRKMWGNRLKTQDLSAWEGEDALKEVLGNFFTSNDFAFDHYFSNLLETMKFIEREAPEQADQYFSILQAQISTVEFGFLAYYQFLDPNHMLSRYMSENFEYRPAISSFVDARHGDWLGW